MNTNDFFTELNSFNHCLQQQEIQIEATSLQISSITPNNGTLLCAQQNKDLKGLKQKKNQKKKPKKKKWRVNDIT